MYFSKHNSLFTFLFVGTCALVTVGCDDETATSSRWPSVANETGFETSSPVAAEYTQEMRFHSVVSGFNSVTKSFFESGRVEKIYVVEGQSVEAGEVLGTLYSPTLSEELQEAQASLEKARAEKKLNQEDLARSVRLFEKRVISRQELDALRRNFLVSEQEVNEAEAIVTRTENELENLNIIASETGIVSQLFKREGDFLNAGEPLLQFESTARQKVSFQVPERLAFNVQTGSTASIYLPALDEIVTATVIEKALPDTGGVALHKLTYEIESSTLSLVGLRSVLLLQTKQSLAYKIDYRAIRYSKTGTPYVIRADDNFTMLPIELIDLNADSAYVKANFAKDERLLLGLDTSVPINLHQY